MRIRLKLFTTLALLLLAFRPVYADKVDDYISEQMSKRHVPGISVAVVNHGQVALAKGYGLSNAELGTPATPDTVFELASVTKQFTATAVMMLIDDGKLSLDDDLLKVLPNLPAAWADVKVRHLLNHTSGIKSYTSLSGFMSQSRKDYAHDELVKLVANEPMDFKPGEKHFYNNTGYYLLGMIIEKVSGKTYGEFLQDRIFKPLGMTATRVNSFQDVIKNRANGYSYSPAGLRNCEYVSPTQPFSAGALLSTVNDMTKWDSALNSETLVKKSVLDQMWTKTKLNDGKEVGYGFGWSIGSANGHRVIGHGGGIPGFSTQIDRYVDDKLTVIVLANSDSANAGAIAKGIAVLYVPALAASASASATDADKHAETTKLVRSLIQNTLDGKLDPAVFTDEMRKALFPDLAKQAQAHLKTLGDLKSITFMEVKEEDKKRAYSYRVVLGTTTLICHCALDEKGKVAGLLLQPE